MSYLDPPRRPDDWADWPPRDDPEDGGAAAYGRHRARHSAAAPDPYAPYPRDGYPPPGTGTGWEQPGADGGGTGWEQVGAEGGRAGWEQLGADGGRTGWEQPGADGGRTGWEQLGAADGGTTGWDRQGGGRNGSGWDQSGAEDWGAPAAEYVSTAWDQPTAEQPSSVGQPSTERFDIGTPPTGGTGRSRGRRRRGRRQRRDHHGTTVAHDAGQAKSGRAGRNLPAAIAVGVTLGAVVVCSLFLYRPAFLAVIAVAVGIGIWELSRAVHHADAHPPLVPLILGGVLMGGLAWYEGPDALLVGLLVTVLAAMVWRLADGPAGYQRDLSAATLIAVYVPFLGSFAALLAEPDDGARRVIVTLAAVVLSDTGGYASGVFFGKHPMAPRISPKKSWEGLAGSLVAAAAGGAVLLYLLLDVALWWGAVFGLAISVASVLGDLAESMLKRDLGVKDMSNLLPGHGGLMDRLDSILFAVPTAYLLLSVLAPLD
jgi:phosphatidate cytidylyltransferase